MRVVVDRDLPGGRGCVALVGDSSELDLPECSVDSLVLDPPAGIGFMGKTWDGDRGGRDAWSAWLARVLAPAYRALKPGGHGLAWALPRTSHWTATALELAGFEVRDVITHLFGSGFPKSLNVSKAIDERDAAEERRRRALAFTEWMRSTSVSASQINELTDSNMGGHYLTAAEQPSIATAELFDKLRPHLPQVPEWIEKLVRQRTVESENTKRREVLSVDQRKATGRAEQGSGGYAFGEEFERTRGYSDEARAAEGLGTAIKPASEHWILFRKPLDKLTVAACVVRWGTGALRIDECRIGDAKDVPASASNTRPAGREQWCMGSTTGDGADPNVGRWPANLVLSHADDCELIGNADEARALYENVGELGRADALDFGMGKQRSSGAVAVTREVYRCADGCPVAELDAQSGEKCGTHGIRAGQPRGASAVFGKASNSHAVERDLPPSKGGASRFFYCAKPAKSEKNRGIPDGAKNQHPTVKPIALMRYLIRLVTPAGGVVLDPFAGTGTTGIAAIAEGLSFVGCELGGEHGEYVDALVARLEHACDQCDQCTV